MQTYTQCQRKGFFHVYHSADFLFYIFFHWLSCRLGSFSLFLFHTSSIHHLFTSSYTKLFLIATVRSLTLLVRLSMKPLLSSCSNISLSSSCLFFLVHACLSALWVIIFFSSFFLVSFDFCFCFLPCWICLLLPITFLAIKKFGFWTFAFAFFHFRSRASSWRLTPQNLSSRCYWCACSLVPCLYPHC